jgi:hypothetical protein
MPNGHPVNRSDPKIAADLEEHHRPDQTSGGSSAGFFATAQATAGQTGPAAKPEEKNPAPKAPPSHTTCGSLSIGKPAEKPPPPNPACPEPAPLDSGPPPVPSVEEVFEPADVANGTSLHSVEPANRRFGTFDGPLYVPAPIVVPPPAPDDAQGWRAGPADTARFAGDPPQVDLMDGIKGQFPYEWMFMPYGYLAYSSPPGQDQDAGAPHPAFAFLGDQPIPAHSGPSQTGHS